jgi:hypothetical protein
MYGHRDLVLWNETWVLGLMRGMMPSLHLLLLPLSSHATAVVFRVRLIRAVPQHCFVSQGFVSWNAAQIFCARKHSIVKGQCVPQYAFLALKSIIAKKKMFVAIMLWD